MSQIAIVGLAFCQIRNKLSKIYQRLVNICQIGEISPNLVTLRSIDANLLFEKRIKTFKHKKRRDHHRLLLTKKLERVENCKSWALKKTG